MNQNIFKVKIDPSTATICKLRNCEKPTLQIEYDSGEKKTVDIEYDPETKEGMNTLRKTLENLTDMTKNPNSKKFRSVDIGFPIPFLEV